MEKVENKRNADRYKCLTCGKITTNIKSFGGVSGHCRPGDLIDIEDKRYYTPEKDEFYIGFKYEEYYNGIWNKKTVTWGGDGNIHTWNDFVINQIGKFYRQDTVFVGTATPALRVKYLDEEDIKSFGFNSDKTKLQHCKSSSYIYKNYELINNYMGNFFTVRIYTINPSNEKDTDIIFHGVIKNKSELKKVLKKLSIYE